MAESRARRLAMGIDAMRFDLAEHAVVGVRGADLLGHAWSLPYKVPCFKVCWVKKRFEDAPGRFPRGQGMLDKCK